MSTSETTPNRVPKANRLEICDLSQDIIILIFSSLHGQDVATCIAVRHSFADLIHSDLSLQYSIELAQNGMVDGESSTLPVSERLKRLRQYSLDFKKGAFQRQDLVTHPDYVPEMLNVDWPLRFPIGTKCASRALYKKVYENDTILYLSLFVPGSAHAGIRSTFSLFTIHAAVKPDLIATEWAMDDAQDLFVVADVAHMSILEPVHPRTNVPECHIRFYSLSALKTDTVIPHPAATLHFIHLSTVESATLKNGFQLRIVGDYVVLETRVEIESISTHFIDAYSWKTGKLISRCDIGSSAVSIIPLDEPYLLLFPLFNPRARTLEPHPNLTIFNFLPSSNPDSSGAGRRVCSLQLPPLLPGEGMEWPEPQTGARAEETTGHFHADLSRSIVTLTLYVYTQYKAGGDGGGEYATHVLIPRATLASQIRAAESRLRTRNRDSGPGHSRSGSVGGTMEQPEPEPMQPPSVPWAVWGPHGCLRLRLRRPHFKRRIAQTPFGSRMPVVVFDGPGSERESAASVYVFDLNPLVARSLRAAPSRRSTGSSDESDSKPEPAMAADLDALSMTAVVQDIEEVLPGAVDPECTAVPYVAYRFPLPRSGSVRAVTPFARGIRKVTMSMAGFTVEFRGQGTHEETRQTWTV
ncbi:hypothetical protein V8D89_005049 [Ganoderma adspersum]